MLTILSTWNANEEIINLNLYYLLTINLIFSSVPTGNSGKNNASVWATGHTVLHWAYSFWRVEGCHL